MKVRLLLLATLLAAAAETVSAAPAPFAKSPRHAPSPDTLLVNFRAEGYTVQKLERGSQPGTYAVTTIAPATAGRRMRFQFKTFTVRADGPDVRGAIREVLEGARRAYQEAMRNQFEEW